jgi:uncharacterized cupin superfamily protein
MLMNKVNTNELAQEESFSPGGKYGAIGKDVSIALGRDGASMDLLKRHPFDVEISRIPPGKTNTLFHAHSAQWEFYHVIEGQGKVRDEGGVTPIESGDAFIFQPGEAHQIINDGDRDLIVYVIADNPISESIYLPDEKKWIVKSPGFQKVHFDSDGLYAPGE